MSRIKIIESTGLTQQPFLNIILAMGLTERLIVGSDAELNFRLLYESFVLGEGERVLPLATVRNPPLTDDVVIEDHRLGLSVRSTQPDFEPLSEEICARLDGFFDNIIPGGSAHVHEARKSEPTKSEQEPYFNEKTYRIPTRNRQIELVVINRTDDRSYSWHFQLERKPKSIRQRISELLNLTFDPDMLPPDRF